MNVLFLTLSSFDSINDRGIYSDLMRKIVNEGHAVYVVTPIERRMKQSTNLLQEQGCQILRVKTLNIKKTNVIEKGIGTYLVEYQFKSAIKKTWEGVTFDLVMYSTPPITFIGVISYIKKRDNAKTYLLLKDIFPQNAVDLGMIRSGSLLHRYFRRKESDLYSISDRIGCMSPANVNYLCQNNLEVDSTKIHVNPNSIEIIDRKKLNNEEKSVIRLKYNIQENAILFIYGGNLGKPQGVGFLLEILTRYNNRKDFFFLIAGSGTEYNTIANWFQTNNPMNSKLLQYLPKVQFEELLAVADVGLIFLDCRFTIPNFPSRLLSYLDFSLPIIAATDTNTDIGKIAFEHNFGFWCKNGDFDSFKRFVTILENEELRKQMGKSGNNYLRENYTVDVSYSLIFKK